MLMRSQAGSKFVQRQLLKAQPKVTKMIMDEIEPEIVSLMMDTYANYTCSVCFEASTVEQRMHFIRKLSLDVKKISCSSHGTHSMQSLLGLLATEEEQDLLMQALTPHILEIAMDERGTHVIQKLLVSFKPQFRHQVYIAILQNFKRVVCHAQGLCVVKKVIEHAVHIPPLKDLLLKAMHPHVTEMAVDNFGNYAIQHAFENWGGDACRCLMEQLKGNLQQMTLHKFASNVVEKTFKLAPPDLRLHFISELLDKDKLVIMCNGAYAQYVFATVLDVADGTNILVVLELAEMLQSILPHLTNRQKRSKFEKVIKDGLERHGGINGLRAIVKSMGQAVKSIPLQYSGTSNQTPAASTGAPAPFAPGWLGPGPTQGQSQAANDTNVNHANFNPGKRQTKARRQLKPPRTG